MRSCGEFNRFSYFITNSYFALHLIIFSMSIPKSVILHNNVCPQCRNCCGGGKKIACLIIFTRISLHTFPFINNSYKYGGRKSRKKGKWLVNIVQTLILWISFDRELFSFIHSFFFVSIQLQICIPKYQGKSFVIKISVCHSPCNRKFTWIFFMYYSFIRI